MAKLSLEARKYYKPRIGNVMASLVVATALIFWGAQVLLTLPVLTEPIAWFIGLVGDLVLFLWLFLLRVNYFNKNSVKKVGLVLVTTIIEAFPLLDDLPAEIVEVILLIVITRIEDVQEAERRAAADAKAAQEENLRQIQLAQYMQRRNAQLQEKTIQEEDADVIQSYKAETYKSDFGETSDKNKKGSVEEFA